MALVPLCFCGMSSGHPYTPSCDVTLDGLFNLSRPVFHFIEGRSYFLSLECYEVSCYVFTTTNNENLQTPLITRKRFGFDNRKIQLSYFSFNNS